MSALVRQEIADAVSSVPRLTCAPYFRQTTKPGDAMVRLDRIAFPNTFGGVATWQVLVLLPKDTADAERYLEDVLPELLEALAPKLAVTSVTPQQLAVENGIVPALVVEGNREN